MDNLARCETPAGHVDSGGLGLPECGKPLSHEQLGREWCRFRVDRNRVAGMDGLRLTDALRDRKSVV